MSDMNSLYVIGKTDSNQRVDEIANIKGVHYPAEIDDFLPLDWADADANGWIECRYHKRFRLKEDTFAVIRPVSASPLKIYGRSMGCIACAVFNAMPTRLGRIDNLSMGGLLFHHVDCTAHATRELVLDILLADCGFYLANLSFKIITDVVIPADVPGDAIDMRQVRLQFEKLNAIQQVRLRDFIGNHGTEFE